MSGILFFIFASWHPLNSLVCNVYIIMAYWPRTKKKKKKKKAVCHICVYYYFYDHWKHAKLNFLLLWSLFFSLWATGKSCILTWYVVVMTKAGLPVDMISLLLLGFFFPLLTLTINNYIIVYRAILFCPSLLNMNYINLLLQLILYMCTSCTPIIYW